ncbi:MAG: TonB-dependent receptor [Chitinophagaceae bacterium]|jgi:outer membrane receptor for ferrienterochelin and colicins|nr:TonB-dependent receptor [Chitinophagaceae bacterium]
MQKFIFLLLFICTSIAATAQQQIRILIKDKATQTILPGASILIKGSKQTVIADSTGAAVVLTDSKEKMIVVVSHIGYETAEQEVSSPFLSTIDILLVPAEEEEEEIIITSTRSTRSIRTIPTRVEFIAGEELDEKANMKPGDIRMLLNESTGIQTQQTSATSANAAIRIQGLDGRYTQILKDGFPLYSGAASGLGLLQIPPLDLKQAEIIKGSSSTLYGGGAIAGLVNLISKTPTDVQELKFHFNGTTAAGLDLNMFYGKRFNKFGVTLFAARNSNAAYDPAEINLSAIPKFQRYTVNPRLFFYPSEKTKLVFGINTVVEDRLGGNMDYIKKTVSNGYYEQNKTKRFSTQFSFDHDFGTNSHLTIKQSINSFNRIITSPGYTFDGKQLSTFSEANYSRRGEIAEWVAGINLWTEDFKEQQTTATPLRNYQQVTTGLFVQNVLRINEWLHVESGLRGDYVIDYGFAFLPRVSILLKPTAHFTSRIGGGLGYKAPSIFTEESERLQYKQVLAVNPTTNKLEKSYGVNADFNYKTNLFEELSVSINQLFFYTRINNPLLLRGSSGFNYSFVNINGHIDTRGTETNIKLGYNGFKLFLGYTFTDTKIHEGSNKTVNPLTPRNRINTVLMYEVEEKWKLGLEAYYFDKQQLNDGATGKPYWICGFMAERLWEKFSLYINFENFLDARQTRFDSIYTGSISNPVFRDIYAPLDGFVVNGGLKLKL